MEIEQKVIQTRKKVFNIQQELQELTFGMTTNSTLNDSNDFSSTSTNESPISTTSSISYELAEKKKKILKLWNMKLRNEPINYNHVKVI